MKKKHKRAIRQLQDRTFDQAMMIGNILKRLRDLENPEPATEPNTGETVPIVKNELDMMLL